MLDQLQLAIYQTAAGAAGGIAGLAKRLGRNPGSFFNRMSFQEGHTPNILDIHASILDTGDHRIIHALAHEFGYTLYPIGEFSDCSDVELISKITALGSARGKVDGRIFEALEDGIIRQHDARDIRELVNAAVKANMELLSRIDALAVAEDEGQTRSLRPVSANG